MQKRIDSIPTTSCYKILDDLKPPQGPSVPEKSAININIAYDKYKKSEQDEGLKNNLAGEVLKYADALVHQLISKEQYSLYGTDVAQNSTLKVIYNLERFREESAFSTWVTQIVLTEIKIAWRKDDRHSSKRAPLNEPDSEQMIDHSLEDLSESAIYKETEESILTQIRYLSEPQRKAIFITMMSIFGSQATESLFLRALKLTEDEKESLHFEINAALAEYNNEPSNIPKSNLNRARVTLASLFEDTDPDLFRKASQIINYRKRSSR
jgi:DNA-directed RNA polymerase specialized sigma24 family protein